MKIKKVILYLKIKATHIRGSRVLSRFNNRSLLVGTIIIFILLVIPSSLFVLGAHKSQDTKSTIIPLSPMLTPDVSPTPVDPFAGMNIPTPTSLQKTTITSTQTQSITPTPTTSNASSSSTYSISGNVYVDNNNNGSEDNGEGLSGVTVWILSIAKSATTDGSGHYNFGGLSAGTYNVTVNVPNSSYVNMNSNPSFVTITNGNGGADFGFKIQGNSNSPTATPTPTVGAVPTPTPTTTQ